MRLLGRPSTAPTLEIGSERAERAAFATAVREARVKNARAVDALWFEADRIPGFKLGRAVRFRESEIEAWLEARRVTRMMER